MAETLGDGRAGAVVPPPGTGLIRLRVRVPSGRIVAVCGSTCSELHTEGWLVRGELATSAGEVQAREQGAEALILRDRLHTYTYTYATLSFVITQTPPRVRVEWQYAPGLGAAVSFEVWRQVVGDALFMRLATVEPVEDRPATYRYLDAEVVPGVTYAYYVTALTATGAMSPGSEMVTVDVPHALQAPKNMAAVFLDGT